MVVKVGTNVLSQDDGMLDLAVIEELVRQISLLKQRGVEVILVTSGAVGAGLSLINPVKQVFFKDNVMRRQILAAVGQVKLMEIYNKMFSLHGFLCAQVLVTKEDFRDEQHFLNMQNCFSGLFTDQIIPIVNENDVVAVSELMFTDNDELAGLIAKMMGVDLLLILSNVEGIFDRHPKEDGAKLFAEIEPHEDLSSFISEEKSSLGRGGMLTKARIAQGLAQQGVMTHIVHGKKPGIVLEVLEGKKVGSRFLLERVEK